MRFGVLFCGLLAVSGMASAGSLSFVGSLDPNNPNDVFETTFLVHSTGFVNIQTLGYGGGTNAASQVIGSGGFDPYVSLFLGAGPTATFLASNDDGSCPPGTLYLGSCLDSTLTISLSPGTYTLALTQPDNFSFAENLGSGTLGDGFIGLESDYHGLTTDFAVDIRAESVAPTPEPGSLALLGAGIGLLMLAKAKRR